MLTIILFSRRAKGKDAATKIRAIQQRGASEATERKISETDEQALLADFIDYKMDDNEISDPEFDDMFTDEGEDRSLPKGGMYKYFDSAAISLITLALFGDNDQIPSAKASDIDWIGKIDDARAWYANLNTRHWLGIREHWRKPIHNFLSKLLHFEECPNLHCDCKDGVAESSAPVNSLPILRAFY